MSVSATSRRAAIPPIPDDTSSDKLISVINDRFRRVPAAPAATTATSSTGATPDYYDIPIISGVASPDLSKGRVQAVTVTVSALTIADPANFSGERQWILVLFGSNGGPIAFGPSYVGVTGLVPHPNTYLALTLMWRPDGAQFVVATAAGGPLP